MTEILPPDPTLFTQAVSDFSFGRNYGDPIRSPPGTAYPAPDCLYMVFLEFGADGKLIVKQLFAPQLAATVAATENGLFDDAVDNNGVLSTNFENLVWNRPCYVTFVLRNVGWKFYWRDQPKQHDSINFLQNKEGQIDLGKTYVQNKSFYNGKHIKVKDKNGIDHDAVRCENYVRDGNGNAIPPGKSVDYCFEIYLEAPFALPHPATHITIIIDPDGENQGPRTV